MKAGYNVAIGRPVKNYILVPVYPITKETLKHYPGWLGPVLNFFSKAWPANKPVWKGRDDITR